MHGVRHSHEAQLPAHHRCAVVIPAVVTHAAPLAIQEHLHASLFPALASHQPHQGTSGGQRRNGERVELHHLSYNQYEDHDLDCKKVSLYRYSQLKDTEWRDGLHCALHRI